MKINNETRFPYPVLSPQTGDYKQGDFSVDIIIEEVTNGKLKMRYTVSLKEPSLEKEVEGKSAAAGIFVTCPDTFYSKITFLNDMSGALEFAPGTFKGRCIVRPLVFAIETISNYANNNLHDEYDGIVWDFPKGALLAIGSEFVLNVGHEKLAPMESIFTLAVNEELVEEEIRVQPDGNMITIHCSSTTYGIINNLRGTKIGQSVLLNSVYLPVVMEVLSNLRDNESVFTDKKWFKVFNAKCEHLGIVYANTNMLEDAQKLLKFPISKLKSIGDHL